MNLFGREARSRKKDATHFTFAELELEFISISRVEDNN